MKFTIKTLSTCSVLLSLAAANHAIANDKDLADMSDPLAVYTQAGLGYTDQGLNLKLGKSYSTGIPTEMAMNVIEIKGSLGDLLPLTRSNADNSIDSIRFRNFKVDVTTGRGAQIDGDWDFDNNFGYASYSLIQALPKVGRFTFYPLAGAGVTIANNMNYGSDESPDVSNGFSVPGVFAVAGMYSKVDITETIWLNYNPTYSMPLAGATSYKNSGNTLAHELSMSYQINPRMNVRYFANFTRDVNFADGDHRVEVNYQF